MGGTYEVSPLAVRSREVVLAMSWAANDTPKKAIKYVMDRKASTNARRNSLFAAILRKERISFEENKCVTDNVKIAEQIQLRAYNNTTNEVKVKSLQKEEK